MAGNVVTGENLNELPVTTQNGIPYEILTLSTFERSGGTRRGQRGLDRQSPLGIAVTPG